MPKKTALKESYNSEDGHEAVIEKETVVEEIKKPVYYTKLSWKNVKDVFACSSCGMQLSTEDDIKLHVLTHFPGQEELVLENILKGE